MTKNEESDSEPMSSLTSTIFQLRPLSRTPVPAENWWGRAVHGLFFNTMKALDQQLAEQLHPPAKANGSCQTAGGIAPQGSGMGEEDAARNEDFQPFTASTLFGSFTKGMLQPDQLYSFRITTLDEGSAAVLEQATAQGRDLSPGSPVVLANRAFQIVSIARNQQEDPWARADSYCLLAQRFCQEGDDLPHDLTFHLVSPAFYKERKTGEYILPMAGWLFANLQKKWNRFAPREFPRLEEIAFDDLTTIFRFDLRSQAVLLKGWNAKRVGAVGQITFTRSEACSTDGWRALCLLAAYARYAGVGAATPLGFGQCWVEPF